MEVENGPRSRYPTVMKKLILLVAVGPTIQSIEYERTEKISRVFLIQWSLKQRQICPQGIYDNVYRHFRFSDLGKEIATGWYLLSRGQGCCYTSYSALDSLPITECYPSWNVIISELKNPCSSPVSQFQTLETEVWKQCPLLKTL